MRITNSARIDLIDRFSLLRCAKLISSSRIASHGADFISTDKNLKNLKFRQ